MLRTLETDTIPYEWVEVASHDLLPAVSASDEMKMIDKNILHVLGLLLQFRQRSS